MESQHWIYVEQRAASPDQAGWYSICFSWEAEEDVMAGAAYFDGKRWQTDLPIVARSPRSFLTQAAAEEYAEEFDPGYPT